MVIGEVIGIYINNKFIKNGRVDSVLCVISQEWDIANTQLFLQNLV